MSDDEYFLRDDLANLDNVDWAAILDAPPASAALRPCLRPTGSTVQANQQAHTGSSHISTPRPAVVGSSGNTQPPPMPHQPPRNVAGPSMQQQRQHPQLQTNRPQTSRIQPAAVHPTRNQPQQQHLQRQITDNVHNHASNVPSRAPTSIQTEQAPHNRAVSPASSNYFDDEDDMMDPSFLAELDRIEQNALANSTSRPMGTSAHTHANAQPNRQLNQPAIVTTQRLPTNIGGQSSVTNTRTGGTTPQPQIQRTDSDYALYGTQPVDQTQAQGRNGDFEANKTKRPRPEESSPSIFSPRKKGKMKPDDNQLTQVISGYEDELSCPICCDLFVAAHSANPCGHTFCGECEWQWQYSTQNPKRSCPVCRQQLAKKTPMIPNLAVDNIVEKHVQALASINNEWSPGGTKNKEWMKRKQAWRDGAETRAKRSQPTKRRAANTQPDVQPDVAPGDIFFVDNDEEDSTYEDSDVELIPRPIQRARRTISRARVP